MKKSRAMNVLIDLDGTLTDPRAGFVACINHALTGLGQAARTDDEIAAHIGPPLSETLSTLLGARHEHRVDDAVALYRERYSSSGILEATLYADIPPALEELRSSGARLFVATSKPRTFALRILDHFDLSRYFSGVYGSELDGTRADKRHLIAYILERESMAPETAVMVGDRAQDIRGAQANGLGSVGVLWGYGSRAELEAVGADALIEHPAQLVVALSSSTDDIAVLTTQELHHD
jgi:phosphoglycolate phosphatase